MARGDAVIYRSYASNGHQFHQPASGVEVCITSILITGYDDRAYLIHQNAHNELFPLQWGGSYTGARTGHSVNMKMFTNNTDFLGLKTAGNVTIYYIITGIQTK